jgi:hypothetical protein
MKHYVTYNQHGMIKDALYASESSAPLNVSSDETIMDAPENVSIQSHWVDQGVIVEKTDYPFAITNSGLVDQIITVNGLPVGSIVRWPDHIETEEIDGELTFTTNTPGEYEFVIRSPQYYRKEFTINVTS